MKDIAKNIANCVNGCAAFIVERNLFGVALTIAVALALLMASGSCYAQYQHEQVYKERATEWEDKYDGVQYSLDSLKVISKENNDMLKILILRK